jgi:E3 ubiquitin-protein ligase synoviolin
VFRCIDDLMRVRSSLPPSTSAPTPAPVPSPSTSIPSPSGTAGINQLLVASAAETLDEAISNAQVAAESGSKVEENLMTDISQPESSNGSPPSTPLSNVEATH